MSCNVIEITFLWLSVITKLNYLYKLLTLALINNDVVKSNCSEVLIYNGLRNLVINLLQSNSITYVKQKMKLCFTYQSN